MTQNTKSTHITAVGENVFADLGFSPKEAAALQAKSKRIISEKLAIKESLMAELSSWIDEKKLKQHDAAIILGRVNIDVDSRGVEFEEQHIGRMAVAVQDIGVGLPDGVR